jgi:hypothetical protein
MLAVALKVLVPAGFMVGAPANGSPLPIVLCTGQGTVTLGAGEAAPGHERSGHAPANAGHDSPCAFAGHGLGAPPPSLFETGAAEFVGYVFTAPSRRVSVTPGRGLSGPPLPARGPPSLLI